MKFYRDKKNTSHYLRKITDNNLSAIRQDKHRVILFFKNGKYHNSKNASYDYDGNKLFYLNGKMYGNETNFTKESWRKFARELKLKVFL